MYVDGFFSIYEGTNMPASPNESVVLWTGVDLATTARKAADYDNVDASGNPQTNEYAYVTFTCTYDATPPVVDDAVAALYVLPQVNGSYPIGGDGVVGEDYDPQDELIVGWFTTRKAAASVTETMGLVVPRLPNKGCRFVVRSLHTSNLNGTKLEMEAVRIRP